jgi:hypothetical protein
MRSVLTHVALRYIPTICVNTTKQSTVYVSLISSAQASLYQDAAGILSVTVIATETFATLQEVPSLFPLAFCPAAVNSPLILPQQLRAAEEAASKALPQWATALIVIFALVAVVATVVVGFFLKRARSALEVPTLLNENICSFLFL